MKIRMTSLGLPAALLAASLFGACSNTAKGIEEDTAQNTAKAKEASADAAAASERAAADAKVNADKAAEATKDAAGNAVDATKEGLEKATEATKSGMNKAADATKDAAHDASVASKNAANSTANAMDGAAQTVQIKTALLEDKSVDASHIDVDTNGTTKVVTLKGHVPNSAQKASATRIAKSKAADYTIVNNLVIG
jgi:osmotically-inducible protein OsmY